MTRQLERRGRLSLILCFVLAVLSLVLSAQPVQDLIAEAARGTVLAEPKRGG